jgi:predicted transcriptional regulator
MTNLTTIKVSVETRDRLRELAAGESIEKALRRILRREWQRQVGIALAQRGVTSDDQAWLQGSNSSLATHMAATEVDDAGR